MKARDAQIDYKPLPNIPGQDEIVLPGISTAICGSTLYLYHDIWENHQKGDKYMKNNRIHIINKDKEVKFSKKEEKFLLENEVCRVATSHNDIPHITPVSYIYENSWFFIATDYDTRKYKNLKANKNIALAVDIYNSSVENKAIVIQGTSHIIERGEEFKKLYQKFDKKFEWVRNDPWKEGEAPFIKVKPFSKISWGLEENGEKE